MADQTQDAPLAKPELGEAATSGDGLDITLGFFGTMRPNSDPILAGRGGDLAVYEELLRDDQVQSCFQQRKRAIVSAEWEVRPGGEDKASQMAADFLREMLNNIRFDNATDMMAHGLFYGYSVAECLYVKDGAHYTLDRLKVRRAKRFRFDMDGGLRLLTLNDSAEGKLMPPRKFWTFSCGADNDDEPYGRGLGFYCYWPVWFKKNNIKFWATYQDKFGQPTPVGKFPPGASKSDQNKLLQAISAIHTDSGVIVPEGMMIDLLEAARTGATDYDKFYDRMEGAVAKIILSQTMTTDAKATGLGSGAAEIHMDVREEVTKSDADLLCASFNQSVVKWLTEWNFPTAEPPRVYRKFEEPEDMDAVVKRDKTLYDMGFVPTDERIQEVYGDGYQRKAEVLPGLPGKPLPGNRPGNPVNHLAAAFAEHRDQVDELADQADAAAAAAQTSMVDVIKGALDASSTLTEFQQRLWEILPGLDATEFAEVMRDALALAEVTGRGDLIDGE